MIQENYLLGAIETVSAWDIEDEDFAEAVNDQAKLMSGCLPSDEVWQCTDCPTPTHR